MAKKEVIFLTVPPVGHVKPTIELAKLLLSSSSSISITILTIPSFFPFWDAATATDISAAVSSPYGTDLRFEALPSVPAEYRDGEYTDAFFARFVHGHDPNVRAALARRLAAKTRPVAAIILDVFCWSAIDVACELGVPAYIYVTWNAAMLSFMLHLPTISENLPRDLGGFVGDIDVPGLLPLPASCMPGFVMDEKARELFVDNGRRFREARGLIVNTFEELEPAVMEVIAGGGCVPDGATPPVFAVGPVIAVAEVGGNGERSRCLEWLDEQPEGSVMFICLGSMGCIGAEQVKEVATAIECSGQRFLWVLKTPIPGNPLNLPMEVTNLEEFLPNDFLHRTKEKGMVWPTWVPQAKILAHRAVGGFVTHCGWNSCLESLWFGVPMLTWPLFSDQHLNAFYLVHQLQLAFELSVDRKRGNFVAAEELERGMKCLMGEGARGVWVRLEATKAAARRAAVDHRVSAAVLVDKLIKECPDPNWVKLDPSIPPH